MLSRKAGIPELLTVAFIALKIAGVIDWNWVWVLSPIWIDLLAGAVVLTVLEILS